MNREMDSGWETPIAYATYEPSQARRLLTTLVPPPGHVHVLRTDKSTMKETGFTCTRTLRHSLACTKDLATQRAA